MGYPVASPPRRLGVRRAASKGLQILTHFKPVLLTGCLAVATLTACDNSAVQDAQSRDALSNAIATLSEAEQGYAADAGEDGYEGFRSSRLQEAAGKLEQVISQGTGVAKVEAQRLLADVRLSQARQLVRQAKANQSEVAGQLQRLLSQLTAVEQVQHRIVARGGSDEGVLSALREGDEMVRQNQAGLTSNLSELTAQREAATINAESANETAAGHFRRAEEAEQAAFIAGSDQERNAAEVQAYQARQEGAAAQRKAAEAQIEADRLGRQIASLQTESRLWEQMASQLNDLTTKVREDGRAAADDVTNAGSAKNLGLTAVRQSLEELVDGYRQRVDQPLAEATDKINDALQQLDVATGQAAAADRSGLRFDRLTALVEKARALSLHTAAAREVAGAASAVAASPAVRDATGGGAGIAQSVGQMQTDLDTQASDLAQLTRDTIADAISSTEQLAEDQQLGQATQQLAQALRGYGQQLQQ